jgi:hypothetical protein
VPRRPLHTSAALRATLAPLDRLALGCAIGAWTGLAISISTLILVAKGGATVGPHLELLAQYFPGYSVTWAGSVLGLLYGGLSGFAIGWTFAFTRNLFASIYLGYIKFKSTIASSSHFLDD